MKNSDLLIAITSKDEAEAKYAKVNKYQISNDPNAQKIGITDEEFIKQYPLSYAEVCSKCRESLDSFKQGKQFNQIMAELKNNKKFAFTRKLNPNNSKSSKTTFYSESIISEIISIYKKIQKN